MSASSRIVYSSSRSRTATRPAGRTRTPSRTRSRVHRRNSRTPGTSPSAPAAPCPPVGAGRVAVRGHGCTSPLSSRAAPGPAPGLPREVLVQRQLPRPRPVRRITSMAATRRSPPRRRASSAAPGGRSQRRAGLGEPHAGVRAYRSCSPPDAPMRLLQRRTHLITPSSDRAGRAGTSNSTWLKGSPVRRDVLLVIARLEALLHGVSASSASSRYPEPDPPTTNASSVSVQRQHTVRSRRFMVSSSISSLEFPITSLRTHLIRRLWLARSSTAPPSFPRAATLVPPLLHRASQAGPASSAQAPAGRGRGQAAPWRADRLTVAWERRPPCQPSTVQPGPGPDGHVRPRRSSSAWRAPRPRQAQGVTVSHVRVQAQRQPQSSSSARGPRRLGQVAAPRGQVHPLAAGQPQAACPRRSLPTAKVLTRPGHRPVTSAQRRPASILADHAPGLVTGRLRERGRLQSRHPPPTAARPASQSDWPAPEPASTPGGIAGTTRQPWSSGRASPSRDAQAPPATAR